MILSPSEMDIARDVLLEVCKRPTTSFADLKRNLNANNRLDGTISFCASRDENVVLWAGMSQDFGNALAYLLSEELIELTPTEYLVYLCDGYVLDLPVAKRLRKKGFKSPHWLPVVLNPGKVPEDHEILRGVQ